MAVTTHAERVTMWRTANQQMADKLVLRSVQEGSIGRRSLAFKMRSLLIYTVELIGKYAPFAKESSLVVRAVCTRGPVPFGT